MLISQQARIIVMAAHPTTNAGFQNPSGEREQPQSSDSHSSTAPSTVSRAAISIFVVEYRGSAQHRKIENRILSQQVIW